MIRHLISFGVRHKYPAILFMVVAAYRDVWAVHGAPTEDDVLEWADVKYAGAALILAGDVEERDSRTLLACLALESFRRDVYTCVELRDRDSRRHFARANADEVVSVQEISSELLAQCVFSKGIFKVLDELLMFQTEENELYCVPVPDNWAAQGVIFRQAALALLPRRVLAVGVRGDHLEINPPRDRRFEPGDRLLALSVSRPDVSRVGLPVGQA